MSAADPHNVDEVRTYLQHRPKTTAIELPTARD